jgi:hypothetical protein
MRECCLREGFAQAPAAISRCKIDVNTPAQLRLYATESLERASVIRR